MFSLENCLLKSISTGPPLVSLLEPEHPESSIPLSFYILIILTPYLFFFSPTSQSPSIISLRSLLESFPHRSSGSLPRATPAPGNGPLPSRLFCYLEQVSSPGTGDAGGDMLHGIWNKAAWGLWANAQPSIHPRKILCDLILKAVVAFLLPQKGLEGEQHGTGAPGRAPRTAGVVVQGFPHQARFQHCVLSSTLSPTKNPGASGVYTNHKPFSGSCIYKLRHVEIKGDTT